LPSANSYQVIYQSPVFPPPKTTVSAQGIFGLYKLQEEQSNPYAGDVITFDVVIFGLLYVQSELFKFGDFEVLVQIRRTNRITSIESAIQRYGREECKLGKGGSRQAVVMWGRLEGRKIMDSRNPR
jgi:hypothetical protein